MTEIDTLCESFCSYYADNRKLYDDAIDTVSDLLKNILTEKELPSDSIGGRVKDRDECSKKFRKKYQNEAKNDSFSKGIHEYLTDILGLRIVTLYTSNISDIVNAIKDEFIVLKEEDKSLAIETSPNEFGYKGYHLDIMLNDARKVMLEYRRFSTLRFELQVRTIVQDAWSTLDHKIAYKKNIPDEIRHRVKGLASHFEIADREFESIKNKTEEYIENLPKGQDEVLNVSTMENALKRIYPKKQSTFSSSIVDSILHNILRIAPEISENKLVDIVEQNRKTVDSYKRTTENNFPVYLRVYYSLYLRDKKAYAGLLSDEEKEQFEEWLKKENKVEAQATMPRSKKTK